VIILFSQFRPTGKPRQYKAAVSYTVPSHHRQTLTERNSSGVIFTADGMALGTLGADGVLDLLDANYRVPRAAELVIHFDSARGLSEPPAANKKPRSQWRHEGASW
jgi:hypothetical protein